jgi:hypothetical protein
MLITHFGNVQSLNHASWRVRLTEEDQCRNQVSFAQ